MRIEIDSSEFEQMLSRFGERAVEAAQLALQDCADDLERTAADTVPIDKGTLTRSSYQEKTQNGDGLKITVEFAVRENGFNYAIYMHEATYELGEQSRARNGGVGMSGKRYDVGRKYLERVANGEKQTYINHITNMVRSAAGV